eukprot:5197189-Pyramimonas_sp.AAC.1
MPLRSARTLRSPCRALRRPDASTERSGFQKLQKPWQSARTRASEGWLENGCFGCKEPRLGCRVVAL